MRNLDRREALDQAFKAAGKMAQVRQLDVTDPDSIAACVEASGQVDVLVNNAGFGIGGFVYDLTLDEIREQFETNFFGAVAMVKALLPGMVSRRQGRIINVSSANGLLAPPAMAAYSASKFALEGFSESLRAELRPLGISVVLIEPGMFKTPIFERNRRVAKAAESEDSPFYGRSRRRDGLGAKLAKADGLVTQAEMRAFSRVFRVKPGEEAAMMRVFDIARQTVRGYESYARRIARRYAGRPCLMEGVLDALVRIALADGAVADGERECRRRGADTVDARRDGQGGRWYRSGCASEGGRSR